MSFFLTLLFMFLLYVRPMEWWEPLIGWRLLDYTAGLALAALFLEGRISGEQLKRSPLMWQVLLFWVVCAFSWVANAWVQGLLNTLTEMAPVIVGFYLVALTVNTMGKLKAFLWFAVLLVSFLAIQAIIQFYTGVGLGEQTLLARGSTFQARGIGIFADPNDLALNLVSLTPFLFPAFHRATMSRSMAPGVIMLMPVISGIVFTRSRGGMLGLAAVAWMYLSERIGRTVASVLLTGLLFLMIAAVPRMQQLDTSEASARSRLEHWSYGLSLLRQKPIFGVGWGNFTEQHSHTAHNSFVLVLAECGLVGGVVWVALFISAFRDLYLAQKMPRPPPYLENLVGALRACLVGWLVCAFFLSQTYKFTSFILLGMVVAVLNVLEREGHRVNNAWTMRLTGISGASCVGGIIFMHFAITVLWRI